MNFSDYLRAQDDEECGGICLAALEAILASNGVPDVAELGRVLYKYTDCGFWLSVRLHDGEWRHTGDLRGIDNGNVRALLVGSIVENSDAEMVGREIDLLTYDDPDDAVKRLDHEVEQVNAQACALWVEANKDEEGEE
jgi:hypothetical protein